jgi:amidase
MNPCFETATRLARAIRNGRMSSVEATKAHLDRIARLNGQINALVVVDHERAMKSARAADRARAKKGARLGSLHGVPITLKEAFDVAGLATTSSHPPLKDNVASTDATLVARLRAAGAVILGNDVPELCADFQPTVRCSALPVHGTRARVGQSTGVAPPPWPPAVTAGTRQRHRWLGAQPRTTTASSR